MRTVQEHLTACLALVGPLPTLDVVLHDAVGCILAEDVVARDDLPPQDVAALDGYAVRTRDLGPDVASTGVEGEPGGPVDGVGEAAPRPVRLRVLDDVLAGESEVDRLVEGSAVRIASGGPIPPDADAVVPDDGTDRGIAEVEIRARVEPGHHIRRRAEDFRAGDVVLTAGIRIGPRQIALLAAAGRGRVPVHPRPRVVVVPVGNDLVEAGRAATAGQVFDANGHALASAVQAGDGAIFRVSAVTDERGRLKETIEDQIVRADLLLVTGGLSAGPDDTVKDVLTSLGPVRFDDVGITPGHQLGIGVVGDGIPVIALPGLPVAAQVAFEVFVRPMLRSMAGESELYRASLPASSLQPWESPAGRREFVPVLLSGSPEEGYRFRAVGVPERPTLSALAHANALAVVPEGVTHVNLGDELHCLVFDE